jgi:hypothetical protein
MAPSLEAVPDRPADNTDEIDATPEMIEAGLPFLYGAPDFREAEVSRSDCARALTCAYRAMRRAQPKRHF